jgi:hypothetical protein
VASAEDGDGAPAPAVLASRRGRRASGGRRPAAPLYPLPTRDPIGGGEVVVTRLECPASGITLEGRFSLGWIGALTPEQLEFVGQLTRQRGNVQKLAGELNVAYNTARSRLDAIVAALESAVGEGAGAAAGAAGGRGSSGGPAGGPPTGPPTADVLDGLAARTLTFEEALRLLGS